MLGPLKTRSLDRPVLVSIEALVPPDHFYRHLDAQLDLSFVRDWVRDCYAGTGRPSIDPIVFFKLQLIMFFEGVRSERKLLETAGLHLAHRWYLGYHFDEPLPDHSSLSKIRTRLGLPIFRCFFERVVELCDQAGLVWGKELLFDATKVRANASLDSLVPRLSEVVDDHLVALFAQPKGAAQPPDAATEAANQAAPSSRPVADAGPTPTRLPVPTATATDADQALPSTPCLRAGTCWSSAGSTPSAHRRKATNARGIGWSALPIPTPRR
jgi:transposase